MPAALLDGFSDTEACRTSMDEDLWNAAQNWTRERVLREYPASIDGRAWQHREARLLGAHGYVTHSSEALGRTYVVSYVRKPYVHRHRNEPLPMLGDSAGEFIHPDAPPVPVTSTSLFPSGGAAGEVIHPDAPPVPVTSTGGLDPWGGAAPYFMEPPSRSSRRRVILSVAVLVPVLAVASWLFLGGGESRRPSIPPSLEAVVAQRPTVAAATVPEPRPSARPPRVPSSASTRDRRR